MNRLATACILGWTLLGGNLTFAQIPIIDPLQPVPFPVSAPIFPEIPIVEGPRMPNVAMPTPVVVPTPTPNPIGNPIGNPLGNPIADPIGNPLNTPIGNPLSTPLQTPDVTAVGGRLGVRQQQQQSQQPQSGNQGQGGNQNQPNMRVYVGTYTNDKSKSEGIYQFTFDPNAGTLSDQTVAAKTTNPSFLAVTPSRKFLYAVNEVGQSNGQKTGTVSAFAIDPKAGTLSLLNTEPSGGADPCYVAVAPTGNIVLVANYTGGSISTLPFGSDGKLGDPTSIQHQGSGFDRSRQSSPHAHSIDLTPNGQYAVVADLGLDKLMVYHFDAAQGTLKPNIPPSERLGPGAGPRHLAFHPDGRHAYVINEMASTITLFDFDSSRGTFSALETVHTRPDPKKPNNATAEIVVHPSGQFVYGSNRGDNTIAIFSVAPASGRLTPVGYQPTGGKTPRNFAIDPTGQFLLAGNQDSNTITIFRVDMQTGRLNVVGSPVPCPAPVCIRFVALDGN